MRTLQVDMRETCRGFTIGCLVLPGPQHGEHGSARGGQEKSDDDGFNPSKWWKGPKCPNKRGTVGF